MPSFIALLFCVALMFVVRLLVDRDNIDSNDVALVSIGFVLLASFLSGRLSKKVKLPKVAGYLILGVIVGPHVLGLIQGEEMLESFDLVKGLAVALIALSAGGEIRIDWLRSKLRDVVLFCSFEMIAVLLGMFGALWLMRSWMDFVPAESLVKAAAVVLVTASVMASNSPMVAIAVINETRASGPLSRMILACTVMKDILIILVFTMVMAAARGMLGDGVDVGAFIKLLGVEIFGSIGVGLAVGWLLTRYIHYVGKEMPVMVILVCLLLTLLAKIDTLHLSTLLMGLAAGFYVENFSKGDIGHQLIRGVERLSLPIYCLFFAIAGLALPLDQFAALWHLVPILAALRIGMIWLGTHAAARLSHGEPIVGQWVWAGMVSQAGISLAMASLVQKSFPTWGAGAATLLIAMIAMNEIFGPILLNAAMKRSGEAGKATG